MDNDFVKILEKSDERAIQVVLCRLRKKAEKTAAQSSESNALLEPVRILGPMGNSLGSVTVSFQDTHDLLTFGSLLNDNIIQAYNKACETIWHARNFRSIRRTAILSRLSRERLDTSTAVGERNRTHEYRLGDSATDLYSHLH